MNRHATCAERKRFVVCQLQTLVYSASNTRHIVTLPLLPPNVNRDGKLGKSQTQSVKTRRPLHPMKWDFEGEVHVDPSRDARVEQLEKRLEWMEAKLRETMQDKQSETDTTKAMQLKVGETVTSQSFMLSPNHIPHMENDDSLSPLHVSTKESPQSSYSGLLSSNSNLNSFACLAKLILSSIVHYTNRE